MPARTTRHRTRHRATRRARTRATTRARPTDPRAATATARRPAGSRRSTPCAPHRRLHARCALPAGRRRPHVPGVLLRPVPDGHRHDRGHALQGRHHRRARELLPGPRRRLQLLRLLGRHPRHLPRRRLLGRAHGSRRTLDVLGLGVVPRCSRTAGGRALATGQKNAPMRPSSSPCTCPSRPRVGARVGAQESVRWLRARASATPESIS